MRCTHLVALNEINAGHAIAFISKQFVIKLDIKISGSNSRFQTRQLTNTKLDSSNNEEVETAVRECLRMQDSDF